MVKSFEQETVWYILLLCSCLVLVSSEEHPCGAELSGFVTETRISNQGQNVLFECKPADLSAPILIGSIKWYKDNQVIEGGDKYMLTNEDRMLRITDVVPSDEGVYRCTLNDPEESGTEELCLTVKGYDVLTGCGDNCNWTIAIGEVATVNVTYATNYTGFLNAIVSLSSVFVKLDNSIQAICGANKMVDTVIPVCGDFPDSSFVIFLFANYTQSNVLVYEINSVSDSTPQVMQDYSITITITSPSITTTSTSTIDIVATSSTETSVSISSTPAPVMTSSMSSSSSSSSMDTSQSMSPTSEGSVSNSDAQRISIIVGVTISCALLVVAIVAVILFLFFIKRSTSTKELKLPALSTFSREDRQISRELDDKSNSQPRFV